MSYDQPAPILLTRQGPVARLTFNRPRAMNALTGEMMALLDGHLTEIENDPELRVVVLTGAGNAFCAGVDLTSLGENKRPSEATAAFMAIAVPVSERLARLPKPTIAAVNGLALAGGLEMALNCDLVVAASTARFGDAHANFGLIPGGGSSVKLPRRIGVALAKYLVFSGTFADAETMRAAGLVLRVVEPGELEAEAQRLALELAEKSPLGLARSKWLIDTGLEMSEREAIAQEAALAIEHADSRDAAEGLAAFAAKRQPSFTGH